MAVRWKENDSLDKQKERLSFLMSINHWKKNWHLVVFFKQWKKWSILRLHTKIITGSLIQLRNISKFQLGHWNRGCSLASPPASCFRLPHEIFIILFFCHYFLEKMFCLRIKSAHHSQKKESNPINTYFRISYIR